MNPTRPLDLSTPSPRELRWTRTFLAPRRLVFEAHTRPELVRRWLLGRPGWTTPIREIDLRVGGRYRYVWRRDDGEEMGLSGAFREIVAPERLVATERFDQPWYPGEAIATLSLVERGKETVLTQTMLYESQATRDAVMKSGLEHGLVAGYDRLAEVLAATSDAAGGSGGRA